MSLGCDFAWAHPDPAQIKNAGYEFVIRYLSHDPSKDLTAQERDALWAHGLAILLVWESYAARALAGPQAGIDDARSAVAAAHALGYPDDVPLFFACDTNATADLARPYFAGAASIRPCLGVYGGIAVTDTLVLDKTVRYGWQTSAWSNGRVSAVAHLYQRQRPTLALQGSFDEDVLLQPLPLWTAPSAVVAAPSPIPAQPPLGDSMRVIRNTDNGRCYLAGVGTVFWLETVPQLDTWLGLCGQTEPKPVTTVDLADFAHTNPKEAAA